MGIFSRRERPLVPESVMGALAEYGRAVLAQRSGAPVDERFGWDFVGPVVMAMHGPDRDRLTNVGAYSLLYEGDAPAEDGRFAELREAFLEYMRQSRYSSGHLTRHEADRWIELHGDLRSSFDNIVDAVVPTRADPPSA
jgi:hypothetical protein